MKTSIHPELQMPPTTMPISYRTTRALILTFASVLVVACSDGYAAVSSSAPNPPVTPSSSHGAAGYLGPGVTRESEDDSDDAVEETTKPAVNPTLPGSRDELFGKTPDSENSRSRDALFGGTGVVPEGKGVRIGGFVDVLGSYTYDHPRHWSRGVARLQLTGQGELSPTVKWKLGGRAELDPVYMVSDFYPDRAKRQMRTAFIHGENYLDFSTGDWAFRVGAQQIVWGEVVGLFFADVLSARDMREFLLPGFDIIRIPQWAARAEYLGANSHVEFVWIPVPTFDRIGAPGSDFYPAPLTLPVNADVAALFRDPERPDRKLSNGNFGVRGNAVLAGWDLAAFYYRSFSTQPTFYREPQAGAAGAFAFVPRYDRIWQTGATMSKDLGQAVLRGETIYTHGQRFTTTDVSVPRGVIERSAFDYIVGLEFPGTHDSRLNVQAFQRIYSGGADDIAVRADGLGASVYMTTKLTDRWEPQLLLIHNFKVGDSLIRPRLNWYAARNVVVGFGIDVFAGAENGYFGRFGSRDRVYVDARLDF